MLLSFNCFLSGHLNKGVVLLGTHTNKGICLNRSFLFCHRRHLEWPCASVCTGRGCHWSPKAPWLASAKWLAWRGIADAEIFTVERWLTGLQPWGCTEGGRERKAPFCDCTEVGGGLQWTNFRCEEQKARFSRHHHSACSSTEMERSQAEALQNCPWQPIFIS